MFGDNIQKRTGHTLREVFMNVGGFPQYNSHKNVKLHRLTNKHKVNVIGLMETNMNWRNSPVEHRFGETH